MNRPVYRLLSGRFGAGPEIRILMRRTAEAFGVPAPRTAGLSVEELLDCYARFSAAAAASAAAGGRDISALRRRLYRSARRLGLSLRRALRPQNERECLAVIVMLYRNIGITIRETSPGEYRVCKCYFSSFYTPEICSLISAIDRGIFAGVCGGGRLTFRDRITDGHDSCTARFIY